MQLSIGTGVSANVVPATYKQKKTALAAPVKAGEEGEKAAAVEGEVAEEATPAGMGRGSR